MGHDPVGGGHGFNHSAADLALANWLAFLTHGDEAAMERIFDQSALGQRDKWERQDYRDGTLRAAIKGTRDTYNYGPPDVSAVLTAKPGGYLTIPDQREHFAGCVYVRR